MFECGVCLLERHEPPGIEGATWSVCDHCAGPYVKCDECGEPEHLRYAETRNDRELCSDCFENIGPRCWDCDTLIEGEVLEHNDREYCRDCFHENFTRCDNCLDYERNVYHYENLTLCTYCDDDFRVCDECGNAIYYEDINATEYDYYCDDCYRSRDRQPYRNVSSEILSGTPRRTSSFGVEVETRFHGEPPVHLGEYRSHESAEAPFFSGWRAEEDCTVDAEFPSPILYGPEGLAEIIETFNVIKRHDGYMNASCGQHITVGIEDASYRTPVTIQRLMYVMEETLYALTGAYNRMGSTYASRIKDGTWNSRNLKRKYRIDTREVSLNIREDDLVEFRYPPGTLQATQAAINIGVTQLLAQIAGGLLSEQEIDDLFDEAIEIEESDMTEEEKVHAHVKHGAWLLSFWGWFNQRSEAANMRGLPYDPDDPVSVKITDHAHGKTTHTRLPERNEILNRMRRQIANFYTRMGGDYEEKIAEVFEIFGIPMQYALDLEFLNR